MPRMLHSKPNGGSVASLRKYPQASSREYRVNQPGLMMNQPLLISSIIEHAAAQMGDAEVVSREMHGELFRYRFKDCAARAQQLANSLEQLGLASGCAIATLAWN